MSSALIPKRKASFESPAQECSPPKKQQGRKSKKTRRGGPGAGAKERQQAKRTAAWIKRVIQLRNLARELRSSECSDVPSILPAVNTRMHSDLYVSELASKYVMEHYYVNAGGLNYLAVRESANVSNPTGVAGSGRGVFATEEIAAGKLLCPYVGKARGSACAASEDCGYCLQMYAGLCICAREVEYDIAYLMYADVVTRKHCLTERTACPPNYARYINTVMHGVEADFNCEFLPTRDGLDSMLVYSTRVIEEGSELLIDYGNLFTCL